MNPTLLILQIVGVVIAVVVSLFIETGLRSYCLRVWRQIYQRLTSQPGAISGEELESVASGLPWYRVARVETGIMEVSLAMDAAAMALPAFTQPGKGVSPLIILSFQLVLLLSCFLSTGATLWLYGIYVRQLGSSVEEGRVLSIKSDRAKSRGSLLSARRSGPYALLIYAIILLLIGLGLLPIITAL